MFGFTFKSDSDFGKITKAASRSVITNIRHAAFSIRKSIRNSIGKSNKSSSPGSPVNTRGGKGNVKNSIFAAVEPDNAIIGPRFSFVGDVMEAHEFGKSRYGRTYPKRPTSGPGLLANTDRFAESFRGSIGE
jgi:hypothetical protein